MDRFRQETSDSQARECTRRPHLGKKKVKTPLLSTLLSQFSDWSQATSQKRCAERLYQHTLSELLCLGRHNVTGLLSTQGKQEEDWSAAYRLYQKERFDAQEIRRSLLKEVLGFQKKEAPLVAALDDTILRKTGKKIPKTKIFRDPLSPKFHTNLIRGQRFIQLSAAVSDSEGMARMIPVSLREAPCVLKPKKTASLEEWQAYRCRIREQNLSREGVSGISDLRQDLDQIASPDRGLWVTVDGSYTNTTVLRHLPDRTVLIGRVRKDAALYFAPATQKEKGRKKTYGEKAPTPEALRKDESISWQSVEAFATGKSHGFQIKTRTELKWRVAGEHQNLRLIVIRPLGYRLNQKSRLLYRQPAYLICTNPDLPVAQVIQAYLWRWDIEVNFRDEKTILGMGQAGVRHPDSVQKVPQMIQQAYASLLIAGIKIFGLRGIPNPVSKPKWNRKPNKIRASTQDLLQQLRFEMWGIGLRSLHFAGFRNNPLQILKPEKSFFDPLNAALYAFQ